MNIPDEYGLSEDSMRGSEMHIRHNNIGSNRRFDSGLLAVREPLSANEVLALHNVGVPVLDVETTDDGTLQQERIQRTIDAAEVRNAIHDDPYANMYAEDQLQSSNPSVHIRPHDMSAVESPYAGIAPAEGYGNPTSAGTFGSGQTRPGIPNTVPPNAVPETPIGLRPVTTDDYDANYGSPAKSFDEMIRDAAISRGLDPEMALALMRNESAPPKQVSLNTTPDYATSPTDETIQESDDND